MALGLILLIHLLTMVELQRLADTAARGQLQLTILAQGDQSTMAARNEAELVEGLCNFP